jgi:hypothetical protein
MEQISEQQRKELSDHFDRLNAEAEQLFNAYNEHGPNPWKTWDGKDVPRWEATGTQVQGKWMAVAEARATRRASSAPMHEAFRVHMLTDAGKAAARHIAEAFNGLLQELETICPKGREMSIVVTKLEEAAFFAKKAMAKHNAES